MQLKTERTRAVAGTWRSSDISKSIVQSENMLQTTVGCELLSVGSPPKERWRQVKSQPNE